MWILIFLSIITLEFIIGYYAVRKYQKRLSRVKELGIIFQYHQGVTRLERFIDRIRKNYQGMFWILITVILLLDAILSSIILFTINFIHIIK